MSFRAPYLSKDELRQRAEQFLERYNPNGTIPVPIEFIIESDFAMDIVPVPGLQAGFDVVVFITKDMADIYDRTGIDRSAISKLENVTNENPTIDTLLRYAEVVGKRLQIQVLDS